MSFAICSDSAERPAGDSTMVTTSRCLAARLPLEIWPPVGSTGDELQADDSSDRNAGDDGESNCTESTDPEDALLLRDRHGHISVSILHSIYDSSDNETAVTDQTSAEQPVHKPSAPVDATSSTKQTAAETTPWKTEICNCPEGTQPMS